MALEGRIRLPVLNLIHRRPRLLNKLAEFVETKQRLITIYAPGGYGKSILLADFAQTTDLPVCWCSLESSDRDPTAFLTLLSHSIIDRFHDIEADELLKLVARGDTQTSIRRLTELLAKVGPHIIIIDDYHKAVSAGMTLAINKLLEQLPENSSMIIAARGDMTLETGQIIDLLITERATGLSEEELRFTPIELQRVMLKRFGRQIDLENAREIAQATDGNIAEILLTAHITHANPMISRLQQHLSDDREVIYDYLAMEVFAKQPPTLQHFLLHTSILPDMTVDLCNKLLDMAEGRTYFEALIHNDLFITQVGTGYRYHDLFAKFLRGRLAEDKVAYRQTCIKAAQLLADCARFEEAINLYLSVQAWDDVATVLEAQGRLFYNTGRALTLDSWLAQISEAELDRYPRLLLLRGQILNNDLSEPQLAMTFFEQAEKRFREKESLVGVAEAQVWRSASLRMMGRATEGLTLASGGLDELERLKAPDYVMAWAIRNRGIAHWTAGKLEESLTDLRRALDLFEALDDTYSVGLCHHEIGVGLEKQGNISGAEYHYEQALRIWEALGNANDFANTLNSLGVCCYLRGRYEQALARFKESLDIALQIGSTRRAAFAQAGIGDTYLACQKIDQALEAYTVSTELAREAGVRSLEIYNLVKIGECYYQQQNRVPALNRANQAKEIAAETGLIYEKGLACALQAKVYTHRGEYNISSELFAEAIMAIGDNDVLEAAKTRLWWGYSLLLDLKISAAWEQLQQTIKIALNISELLPGLASTIAETKPLLQQFRFWPDTPEGMRGSIDLLLKQSRPQALDTIEVLSPSLQIFLFGSPTLVVSGQRRQFSQRGRIRKAPEFLAYLLLEGQARGCSWGEVSSAIWPDLNSDKASAIFHQTLRRLREMIFNDLDYIIVNDDYYQVNPDYLDWGDVLAFERLFERATRAAPAEALALQQEIISLYQGEFLAGFELGEWGTTYRTSFENRFLQTVRLAGEQLLRIGLPGDALNVVRQGLTYNYFREDLHRLAFKACARLGLYDQLELYYVDLRTTFLQELSTPPDPTTAQLYDELMASR